MSYSAATAIRAEGARIGIITCLECGAAILLDPRDNVSATELHDRWHETSEKVISK